MLNLFDVERDCISRLDAKPRKASVREVEAYAIWLRERDGLPELPLQTLHWQASGRDSGPCMAATFGKLLKAQSWSGREYSPAEYEPGSFSLLVPGWNVHRETVTLETLDEAGEVVATSSLPVEPKKGGVIWDRAKVRAVHGPVAKPKAKRATPSQKSEALVTIEQLRRELAAARADTLAERERADGLAAQVAEMAALVRETPTPTVEIRPTTERDRFRALYRKARREKLEGAELCAAACEFAEEKAGHWPVTRLHIAVERAQRPTADMRRDLARKVLNSWGHRNGFRSPPMGSPRFHNWQAISARATDLRKRLDDAGRLSKDAGGWVRRVLTPIRGAGRAPPIGAIQPGNSTEEMRDAA